MALASVKEEFKSKRIAFGNSGKPLGEREDLDDLAIMAHESGNPNLLNLFKELPALSVLKKARTEKELKRVVPDAEVEKAEPIKTKPVTKKRTNKKWNAGEQ